MGCGGGGLGDVGERKTGADGTSGVNISSGPEWEQNLPASRPLEEEKLSEEIRDYSRIATDRDA